MGKCAIFTLQRDEFFHLPLWLKYYGQHFDHQDMFILDHESQDPEVCRVLREDCTDMNVYSVFNEQVYNIDWYVETINHYKDILLTKYEYVMYVDCDDWVIPKEGTLRDFIANADREAYRTYGYEVILDKMHAWGPDEKPCLTRIPLVWGPGCHTSTPEIKSTDDLYLYHLHRLSYDAAWKKRQMWQSHQNRGYLYQEIVNEHRYKEIFWTAGTTNAEPYHERLRLALRGVGW
jgi:hypothetical protein